MDHLGCLNYTIRCPVGVGEASVFFFFALHPVNVMFSVFKLGCCLCSWSHQPLEPPLVPADLEDRTCNRYRQHGSGKAQRDDLRDGLDDVQVDAGGW